MRKNAGASKRMGIKTRKGKAMCRKNKAGQLQKTRQEFEGFEVVEKQESANLSSLRGGMQFYMERGGLDLDGEMPTETKAVVARLRSYKEKEVTEEQIQGFLAMEQPPVPRFIPKNAGEIRRLGYWKKKGYKKKMKSFEKQRKSWDKTEAGKSWKSALAGMMGVQEHEIYGEVPQNSLIQKEKAKESKKDKKKDKKGKRKTFDEMSKEDLFAVKELDEIDAYIEEGLQSGGYQEIEADPDVMDQMLEQDENPEFMEREKKISKLEIIKSAKLAGSGGVGLVSNYIMRTDVCNSINAFLRQEGDVSPRARCFGKDAKKIVKWLEKAPLSRDIVSRRGIRWDGPKTVAYMLGLNDPENLTMDEVKASLKEKLSSGEDVTMVEKGLCSTSVGTGTYPAGEEDEIGVEFIILNRKGTQGINLTGNGSRGNERELLLNAGTKFKVIRAYFNDGEPGEERDIKLGSKASWKIYLETIPGANDNKWLDNGPTI